MSKIIDFSMKREPRQSRSRATVEAIVEATAQILARDGYAAVNTNRIAERAGVGIGSVYDFFPGKEALVAAAAEEMIDRMLDRVEEAMALYSPTDPNSIQRLATALAESVEAERDLVAAFYLQVPYIREIPAVQALPMRMLGMLKDHPVIETVSTEPENLYLLSMMVAVGTIEMTVAAPKGLDRDRLVASLARVLEATLMRYSLQNAA